MLGTMAQVEPMDIDDIESDFDNKENSSCNSNVLPRTPCMEKGYEELDVSELNMKLRYSITPASSPMSKSLNYYENNINNVVAHENSNLTRSLNFSITKSEMANSVKSLPLQVLTNDKVIDDRNASVLRIIEPSSDKNNVTITLGEAMDNDENISLPSTSSSVTHTPEATTPTKEIPKHDGGSPIMRGLKSVLNMFRSTQSPIPPSESTFTGVVKQENISPNNSITKETENNRCKTVVVSTPISNKSKEVSESRRSSPLKGSIVFNDDLEKDLQWKNETTIFFKDQKIPIHKLFSPQSLSCNSKTSKDVTKTLNMEKNESKNITEEYMSMSNNASMSQSGNVMNMQLPSLQNEVSALESDGEFVDCEMTLNEEFYNSKITEKEDNTNEKPINCEKPIQENPKQEIDNIEVFLTDSEENKSYVLHKQGDVSNKLIQENPKQEIDNIEAFPTDSEENKSYVLHKQGEVSSDVFTALNSNENILINCNFHDQREFETEKDFVYKTHPVGEMPANNANQNEMISSNIEKVESMKKSDLSTEHTTSTNVTFCDDKLNKCDVEIKKYNEKIHPSEVPLPDENNIDFMELSNSTKDIVQLKVMCNLGQQDLNQTHMSVDYNESVTIEERYCKNVKDENEIQLAQVISQEINNDTNILKPSDKVDVFATKEAATMQPVDLQKQRECKESQIIDTSVNVSLRPVTTELNEGHRQITSVPSQLTKKEDSLPSKTDSDKETETKELPSDEHLRPSTSETSEKQIECKMNAAAKNNSETIGNNVKNENSSPGEITNLKFPSVDFSENNHKSQFHFHENHNLLKDPNSTIEHVSLNNCRMLTTTKNDDNSMKAHNSFNISTNKDHQVNTTNCMLTVMDSDKHLDYLKESDDSNSNIKTQSATNMVEKYNTEPMNQEGTSCTKDDFSYKIDTDKSNKILNFNKGSNEFLHSNNEIIKDTIEKEHKNVVIVRNFNNLTLSDTFTNLDNTSLNEPNAYAIDTTFNMDINKEVKFENKQSLNIENSRSISDLHENVKNIDEVKNFPGESSKKYEDVDKDNNTKIEEILNLVEHDTSKEISATENQDDCLNSKEVTNFDSKEVILGSEPVAVPDNLNHCTINVPLQLEHFSNVKNSSDYNTIAISGINQSHVTTVTPSNLAERDTSVETIEVFACQKEKKSNSKSFITTDEVVIQEQITNNSGAYGKENASSIIKNNPSPVKSSEPKNVFNLPEMSDSFISKLKENATSSAPDAEDRFEHIFKVPSSDFAHHSQNCDSKTDDGDRKLCVDKNELDSSDVSTSSKVSEATVHEVNTEDEDTVEASFSEIEEYNDIDKKSEHEDMIDFSDIPTHKINNNAYKGEMFIDAEAFQFLLNQNKSNVVADSGRESLFLKFDPLFAKRMSSDAATVNKIQKGQSTPKRITKALSNIDFYRNSNETSEINSTLEANFEDATVLLSKPMMVVNPAVNSVFSPRNKSLTPPRANRRSHTFTSPAIAVIDRLLSLSGDNSSLNHEMSITDARRRTNETDQALTQLRELLAEKEINVHDLRSESKELTERLRTLESQVKNLETESEQRFRKVDDLDKCLAEKTKMNKGMAVVVEEYERTIASLTAEIEQDKKVHAEERMKLINERNEQNAHLASMTMSFNDLHSKYEKNKQIILNCKANEEKYKRSIKEFDESVLKIQNNYELLKQHATSNLNNKNDEFEKLNRTHEAEILKYGAMIKRKEMDISSLKETLAQKIKANEELTAICDELLNKVA